MKITKYYQLCILLLLTIFYFTTATAAASSGAFIGTWKLVSFTKKEANGKIIYPYGKNPIGYIIYTKDNMMAVQIMRQPRQRMLAHIDNNYIAYFGRYHIDSSKKIIYHQIQGALALDHLGKNVARKYYLNGNKLRLSPAEKQTTEIVWEKI